MEGIKRIGGKEEAYRKQLKRFREHYSNAVPELQRLLQADKQVEAEAYCHSLKGVTGNIGAHGVYQCVSHIDNLLKQQQTPSNEQIEQLRNLLQLVMADIDSISVTPVAAPTGTQRLPDAVAAAKIAQLLAVLETDLGAAESLISELRAGSAGSEYEADIHRIAAEMDSFNIEEALNLLSHLQAHLTSGPYPNPHNDHD